MSSVSFWQCDILHAQGKTQRTGFLVDHFGTHIKHMSMPHKREIRKTRELTPKVSCQVSIWLKLLSWKMKINFPHLAILFLAQLSGYVMFLSDGVSQSGPIQLSSLSFSLWGNSGRMGLSYLRNNQKCEWGRWEGSGFPIHIRSLCIVQYAFYFVYATGDLF